MNVVYKNKASKAQIGDIIVTNIGDFLLVDVSKLSSEFPVGLVNINKDELEFNVKDNINVGTLIPNVIVYKIIRSDRISLVIE